MTRARLAGALAAAVVGSLTALTALTVPGPPPAAADVEGPDCYVLDEEMAADDVVGTNPVFEMLRLDLAHRLLEQQGTGPGEGVAVVLLDTGVSTNLDAPGLRHVPPLPTARTPEVDSPHGTVAAGLVVGTEHPTDGGEPVEIGVAPAAELHSVPVYDLPSDAAATTTDQTEPDPAAVTAGLRWVLDNRALPGRTVVLVPTAVDPSEELEDALRDLEEQGRLVVAPVGDRPASEEEANTALLDYVQADERPPGEDAGGELWPVAADTVLGVGVTGREDVTGSVVLSSDVDLAAPTMGAVSYALNGGTCEVTRYSSDLAAALVAGVAALVWSAHEDDTAAELRSRLLRTADGNPSTLSRVTGHGVVQPVEALTRDLEPRADGRAAARPRTGERVGERADPPPERQDVLAETRRDAVRWGLVGGAALVVALVLRPVLTRRRTR